MQWKVKVESVESTKTSKGSDMYKIKVLHDGESKFFNVFDAMQAKALMAANESDEEIELRMEQAGEWLNLDRIVSDIKTKEGTVIPKAQPKPKGGFGGAKADPTKIKSIERQSALKQAVEYCTGIQEPAGRDVLEVADDFYKWLTK